MTDWGTAIVLSTSVQRTPVQCLHQPAGSKKPQKTSVKLTSLQAPTWH